MARKKMVMVAVDDLHTVVVGSLAEYQEKCRRADDKTYRKQAERKVFSSMSEMLGLTDGGSLSMREALGLA